MLASARCGAKTRAGQACASPAVRGKTRCRMHGGAPGSGAPNKNKNALKHGLFTERAKIERHRALELLRQARKLINDLE
jgi:glucans biosynthesis protein